MDSDSPRRRPGRATTAAYRKAFVTGFRGALVSPAGRAAMERNFRIALVASIAGSMELLQWIKRSRAAHGEAPLTIREELATAMLGAVLATSLVHLARWLWRRAHRAPNT